MRQIAYKLLSSELSRGLTASLIIHAVALVGVGGMLITPPRPLGAASHTIEIEYAEAPPPAVAFQATSSEQTPKTALVVKTKESSATPTDNAVLHRTEVKIKHTQIQQIAPAASLTRAAGPSLGLAATTDSFENLIPASSTWSPKPPYPLEARQAKFEGKVLLAVKIDSEGSPRDGKVVSSSGRVDCDQVALNTVLERWRFEPATILGRPVSWEQKIEVEYRLR